MHNVHSSGGTVTYEPCPQCKKPGARVRRGGKVEYDSRGQRHTIAGPGLKLWRCCCSGWGYGFVAVIADANGPRCVSTRTDIA